MNVEIDAAWAAGMMLATIRIGAFVAASPILSRTVPLAGRAAFVLALGAFFAEPISGAGSLAVLLSAAVMNVALGAALGFITGLIFHLFAVAGALLDDLSSLRAASMIDPATGAPTPVFTQAFSMIALALFLVIGGDRLIVRGLAATFDVVALNGSIDLDGGLAEGMLSLVATMLVAGIELAIPALAALFAAEVILGIAARFAPQANVFLVGLPVKILTAMATVTFVIIMFPDAFQGTMRAIEETFVDVVGAIAG